MSVNISPADYAAYMARQSAPDAPSRTRARRGEGRVARAKAMAAARLPRVLALLAMEKLPRDVLIKSTPSTPNRWESDYLRQLQTWAAMPERGEGDVVDVEFQPVRLRLADGAFYTPDIVARLGTGRILFVEVKGFSREASRVRIKVAARLFPWAGFCVVRKIEGKWRAEKIRSCEAATAAGAE